MNPLLKNSEHPFGAVAFPVIKVEHYLPALEQATLAAKAGIEAIKQERAPATLANTIEALERATAPVYDIAAVYSNLRSADGDERMHALAKDIMPKLIQLESDINLDGALFTRVKAVYDGRERAGLAVEAKTLVEKYYRSFRRNGALLDDAAKVKLRAIDVELSTLGPRFSEHVLKSTNEYALVLTKSDEVAGLPESAVDAARQTAKERGKPDAWVFTLQMPSYTAFMRYADRRELRQKMWEAYSARAFGGAHDNQPLALRIAELRRARSELLGYKSHAHFQLEERMAEDPAKVRSFLERLLTASRKAAEREMDELRAFMKAGGASHELMPWDYPYWSNKLKESRYALNAEELRPYFELKRVLDGAFEHASRLYGLTFKPRPDVPVYASDVTVYEVTGSFDGNAASSEYMGLFYCDFFPRATKAGGAWCTRFRPQWQPDGKPTPSGRPHVSIVCNFTKPTDTKPSLLTFQEVTTLFHEFGHALHSLLSRCRYRSLSGTSVYRDFVELPSQVMENWIRDKGGLELFARHYQTGAVIPTTLVDKIVKSDNFHAAFMMMRQLRFALLDLAWHTVERPVTDVAAFEALAVAPTDLLPSPPGSNISCSFEHIFSGGYSAGYYGYKWAEVLDADAFELFKEKGIFDRGTADRFRTAILERGGSEHPSELYRRFRGRDPDPDALLRRAQLI